MIVRLPRDAAVDIWAVASDGRRLAGVADGEIDVPEGAVLEVRGRRRARAKLAWLTELGAPVVSVDVRRSEVSGFDLVAAASLPHLAVLTAAGETIDGEVLAAIARAQNLAVLQLTAPSLHRGELLPLRYATRLRQVRLEVPQVPPEEVVDVLSERSLEVFGLAEPRMTAGLFEQVVSAWPLRELSVAVEHLDRYTCTTVRQLGGLVQLAVDGRWAELAAIDVAWLVNGLPQLRQLDLTEAGRQLSPELLVGAWWLRPGLTVNGLTMAKEATERFVERWTKP